MNYFLAIFKNEENNEYIAVVPDITSCFAYADSIEEIYETIQDTAEIILEDETLPKANSFDYFTEDILQELSIPKDCLKHTIEISSEDDDNSYTARVLNS